MKRFALLLFAALLVPTAAHAQWGYRALGVNIYIGPQPRLYSRPYIPGWRTHNYAGLPNVVSLAYPFRIPPPPPPYGPPVDPGAIIGGIILQVAPLLIERALESLPPPRVAIAPAPYPQTPGPVRPGIKPPAPRTGVPAPTAKVQEPEVTPTPTPQVEPEDTSPVVPEEKQPDAAPSTPRKMIQR
jgi:hypothetical protein